MITMNVLSGANDAQRARLKEEQRKQLEGDVDMAEGDLIARVRDGGREVIKPRHPCHFPRSILRCMTRYRAHCTGSSVKLSDLDTVKQDVPPCTTALVCSDAYDSPQTGICCYVLLPLLHQAQGAS